MLGLVSLIACHGLQIHDILKHTMKRSQQIATALSLIPNCIVNIGTLVITVLRHPEHTFILSSSLLGSALYVTEILLLLIVVMLGYFFGSSERVLDVEDQRRGHSVLPERVDDVEDQRSHGHNVLGGGAERSGPSELPPVQAAAGTPGAENSMARHTQEEHQKEVTIILIAQGTERLEIVTTRLVLLPSAHIEVVLVQAIPQLMIHVERDMYIPLLLQASGMADARPHVLLIRLLEIRYWRLLTWRVQRCERDIVMRRLLLWAYLLVRFAWRRAR